MAATPSCNPLAAILGCNPLAATPWLQPLPATLGCNLWLKSLAVIPWLQTHGCNPSHRVIDKNCYFRIINCD